MCPGCCLDDSSRQCILSHIIELLVHQTINPTFDLAFRFLEIHCCDGAHPLNLEVSFDCYPI